MAVEARHLNLFPPQLISNREVVINTIEGNANLYNTAPASNLGYHGTPIPANIAAAAAAENLIPSAINNPAIDFNNTPKIEKKSSDSGITTYNNLNQTTAFSRKRSRDSMNSYGNQMFSQSPINYMNTAQQSLLMNKNNCSASSFSFLGEDVSLQFHQQQFDIDRLISQHMEKVRIEIEEKRKRQARKILQAIEIGLAKRLRAKEEEIEKIGKLNWALEEKVKSLCIENQIWRDLAQSNEATVNALRSNLEQVLAAAAQVKNERASAARFALDDNDDEEQNDMFSHKNDMKNNELADDAQSCCGSSGENDNDVVEVVSTGWRTIGEWRGAGLEAVRNDSVVESSEGKNGNMNNRKCRNCGKSESCVLLLPCRHLCLCTVCGSSLHTCPICKSTKNASVNVNMS